MGTKITPGRSPKLVNADSVCDTKDQMVLEDLPECSAFVRPPGGGFIVQQSFQYRLF
ncbi:hypothetical protein BRAO375_2270003 [Bradyrhizobium sp. ORS 375]|nr:hypothetical protein BRAO375_2270003 [Bradyrhizobium sp. ORS 375]